MPSLYFEQEIGRRSVLRGIGGLAVLGAAGNATARPMARTGTPTPNEWPSFMHTTENTGFNPHASLARPNLRQHWTFGPKDTASDDETNGFGAPVYAHDTVYVGGYERLWAIDPTDGSERWRYNPDRPDPSNGDVTTVGVSGDTVFLGTDHGRVAAVLADDGAERWRKQVGTSDDAGDDEQGEAVRISGLTAGDGYVLAMEDGTTDEPAVLHALDAENGSELWQRDEGSEDVNNPIRPAPPALHDGVVYDTANGLAALDARTGDLKWGPRSPETDDLPAYSDGTIYVSGGTGGNGYYAVNAETGDTEWYSPFAGDSNVGARLSVVDDNRVYAGHETESLNRLVAFDRDDGSKLWTNDEAVDGGRGGFSVDDAVLYANESDGRAIVAFDPTDGSKLWEYRAMERGTVPAVVGSTAYFGGPKVVALGAESTPTETATATPTPTWPGTPTGTGTPTPTAGGTPTPAPTPTAIPTDTETPPDRATATPTKTVRIIGSPEATERTVPGLGLLGTVGGLLGVAGYLRYRSGDQD